jgi:cholesterol transport system auxiliary component
MRYLCISIIAVLLASCAVTKPVKITEVKKYTLTAVSNKAYARRSSTDLFVSPVAAAPGYNTRAMVYVQHPYALDSFIKSTWVAAPAELIHSVLLESLQSAKLFHAVLSPPHSGYARYRLDTKVVVLQQEFVHRPSKVRLIMQASIIDNNRHRSVFQHRFHIVKASPSDSPYGGVKAANAAVYDFQLQLLRLLAQQRL